jgi:RimJ/RimL family protein N-acetyltransferase
VRTHFKKQKKMRDNWRLCLIGPRVRLVPYQRKFVDKYHAWMTDPYVLEMTASEPLTVEEEYEMQQTWLQDPHSKTSLFVFTVIVVDYAFLQSVPSSC